MMAFRLAQDKLNSVKRKNGSCLWSWRINT
jgi:hypothetical protein